MRLGGRPARAGGQPRAGHRQHPAPQTNAVQGHGLRYSAGVARLTPRAVVRQQGRRHWGAAEGVRD